jgi:hypothetical protein
MTVPLTQMNDIEFMQALGLTQGTVAQRIAIRVIMRMLEYEEVEAVLELLASDDGEGLVALAADTTIVVGEALGLEIERGELSLGSSVTSYELGRAVSRLLGHMAQDETMMDVTGKKLVMLLDPKRGP